MSECHPGCGFSFFLGFSGLAEWLGSRPPSPKTVKRTPFYPVPQKLGLGKWELGPLSRWMLSLPAIFQRHSASSDLTCIGRSAQTLSESSFAFLHTAFWCKQLLFPHCATAEASQVWAL